MSSVLRQPSLSDRPLPLGGIEALTADPVVAAEIEAAYRRGTEDGRARALEEESARLAALTAEAHDALRAAVEDARRRLAAAVEDSAAAVLRIALDVAETIVGSLEPATVEALTDRILEALDAIDDEDLSVAVHPDRLDVVAAGLAEVPGVSIQPDPSLGPGEAKLRGRWARADLTIAAAFRNLRETLDARP